MFNLFKKKRRFINEYIRIAEGIASGKILTPSGDKYKINTIYNYRSGVNRFKAWENENGTIYLDDIDLEWAENLAVFLIAKGYCKNTICDTMARLKAVLRRLHSRGLCTYNGSGIRTTSEQVTTIYSTIEDLREMLNFDLSYTPGAERVRDIYVMQCFIGLRFSDLCFVLSEPRRYLREIGGSLFFDIKTRKTGETVVIPVSIVVKQILDKYCYDFGQPFSYQYYNVTIKDIAKRSGLTSEVIFTRTKGGARIDTVRKKYDLMSSHTARRTFATNAFLSGIPEKNIMLITGHKTTASFYRYIRCNSLDAAIKIANHNFFSIYLPITHTLKTTEFANLPVVTHDITTQKFQGHDC